MVCASLEAIAFSHNNYWAPLQGKQDSGVAEGLVEAAVLPLPRKDRPLPHVLQKPSAPHPLP